jgi:hypothetical protein
VNIKQLDLTRKPHVDASCQRLTEIDKKIEKQCFQKLGIIRASPPLAARLTPTVDAASVGGV